MAMISLLFLTWSVILHQCCSFHIFHQQYHLTDVHTKQKQYSPRRSRSIEVHTVMSKLHAKKQQDDDDDDSKPKSTKFSRMLDDFVGKKYGAGEAFYGKRTSDLSEDQYREYLRKTFPTRYIADDDIELKSNAILVIGDPQVELTQWIILELTDKGFKVRLICEDKKEATKVFGKHGYNIDIVTVDQDTLNSDIDKYVNSIQAVLVTTNFLPTFNILKWTKLEQMTKDKFLWTKRILDRAKFVHELGNASIMKIVFLSRYIPGYNSNSSKSRSNILEVLGGALEYSPSDINLTNQLFDAFRQCHLDFESYIKSLRLEYVIMRAPPMVLG